MLFPSLCERMSDAEFHYFVLIWKELCGQMAYLVAYSRKNNHNRCRQHRVTDTDDIDSGDYIFT